VSEKLWLPQVPRVLDSNPAGDHFLRKAGFWIPNDANYAASAHLCLHRLSRKLAACNRGIGGKVAYHGTHYSIATDPTAKPRPDRNFQASPLGCLRARQSRGIDKCVRIGRNSSLAVSRRPRRNGWIATGSGELIIGVVDLEAFVEISVSYG
jgi:hypothetical protein